MVVMTLQQAFDKAIRHVVAQGRPARCWKRGGSAYRTIDGRKCAVGGLIADEHYNSRLEGRVATDCQVAAALRASGVPTGNADIWLRLQDCHDRAPYLDRGEFMRYFLGEARKLAAQFGLAWNFDTQPS